MKIALKYSYQSIFAPYIEGLVLQKKQCGFIYDYESYVLKRFDEFCVEHGYCEALITREIAMEWAIQKTSEGINHRNQRVSFLRQLSLYMMKRFRVIMRQGYGSSPERMGRAILEEPASTGNSGNSGQWPNVQKPVISGQPFMLCGMLLSLTGLTCG